MNYNPLTLSFSGRFSYLESEFLKFRHKQSIFRIRAAIVVAICLYSAFGFLDAAVAPDKKTIFWLIRYGFVCPVASLVLAFTWHPLFERYSHPTLFMLCFSGGIGIILMVILADPPAAFSYYAGIILIFIFISTFLRLQFIWSTACIWLMVICYEIGAVWIAETPSVILISNNFFFLSAGVLCMLANYSIELYERRSFFLSTRLNEAKENITQANALLDRKVKDRTRELELMNQQLKTEIADRIASQESRRKLEAELNRSHRMEAIGTLAGGIAHDFNNILAAVMAYSELTLDLLKAGSEAHENVTGILNAALRAKDLTRQILIFSRQAEQEIQPLQLSLLVKEALKLIRATLPATIEVRQDISSTSFVSGDPGQLHRIVVNLCTNAAHAIGSRPGVLSITLDDTVIDEQFDRDNTPLVPGNYIRLAISDDGCGMPQEVMNKAFDPFFTTKALNHGTGMGLSVVHGIVKNCGGSIQVESKPGSGTIFTVYLPIIDCSPDSASPDGEAPPATGSGHILVVDDDESIVTATRQSLESLGYTVTACCHAHKALELFSKSPDLFDLVLTDYAMPRTTGLELAGQMHAIRPDLPMILCTGYGENLSRETMESAGISRFLIKPVLRRTLGQAIADSL